MDPKHSVMKGLSCKEHVMDMGPWFKVLSKKV